MRICLLQKRQRKYCTYDHMVTLFIYHEIRKIFQEVIFLQHTRRKTQRQLILQSQQPLVDLFVVTRNVKLNVNPILLNILFYGGLQF